MSPLIYAVKHNFLEVVKILISHDARITTDVFNTARDKWDIYDANKFHIEWRDDTWIFACFWNWNKGDRWSSWWFRIQPSSACKEGESSSLPLAGRGQPENLVIHQRLILPLIKHVDLMGGWPVSTLILENYNIDRVSCLQNFYRNVFAQLIDFICHLHCKAISFKKGLGLSNLFQLKGQACMLFCGGVR